VTDAIRAPLTALLRSPRTLGVLALGSGAALLGNILGGISLGLGLAVVGAVVLAGIVWVWRTADAERRDVLREVARAGAIAGLAGVVLYDITRVGLAQIDASPYNPFEAIRMFGTLLVGSAAPVTAVYGVGMLYHFMNGVTFAIGYAFVLGREGGTSVRWALATGVAWGVGLEAFQLWLYPDWLNIKAFAEFATISALSHVVYGATIGLACRWILRRRLTEELV
jgi:hypothetical protein